MEVNTQGKPKKTRFYMLLFIFIYSLTPIQRISNEKLSAALAQTEQERDRKGLFEFPAPRTARFIKEAIEESEEQRVK